MLVSWVRSRTHGFLFVAISVLIAGCSDQDAVGPGQRKSGTEKIATRESRLKPQPPTTPRRENSQSSDPVEAIDPVPEQAPQTNPGSPGEPRSALPVQLPGLHEALNGTPRDEERIQAHGIRKLTGKHLTLYTDLPVSPAVDELPRVFDLAVPQWVNYFRIPPGQVAEWHLVGRLMKDKTRFQQAGLLPVSLPAFGHGFNYGQHLWVYDQETDYYRRHLLLHEGTHGFMQEFLGGSGPAWYSEGMAELLATHRWLAGKLELNYLPRDKKDTPGWGRIKIIKDEVAAGRGVMLPEVMRFPPTAHRQVQPYAWCWAACTFFGNHPRYQQQLRELQNHATEVGDQFSNRLYEQLVKEWPAVRDQWQWFVLNMEYGYDVRREAIDPLPARAWQGEAVEVEIQADRGWQSTGLTLPAGSEVEIVATGRYQLGSDPDPWWCEANGVTIHYYRGYPLGILLAAVNGPNPTELTRLARFQPVGTAGKVSTAQGGVLMLRINDSGASLGDNRGSCKVSIRILEGN